MDWIEWTQRLAAIAQSGLTYARDPFDIERYTQLRELAAEVVAEHTGRPAIDVDDFFRRETGYATPKIDVRGVDLPRRPIALGARTFGRRLDAARRLGGDVLDSPRTAIEREIREESGYDARSTKLLAILDRTRRSASAARPARLEDLHPVRRSPAARRAKA